MSTKAVLSFVKQRKIKRMKKPGRAITCALIGGKNSTEWWIASIQWRKLLLFQNKSIESFYKVKKILNCFVC